MGKKLRVEFKYFDRRTCSRCRTTNKNVEKTVRELRSVLEKSGVEVNLKITKLPASKLNESNSVLINGRDIEEILGVKENGRSTSCFGCGDLLNSPCNCRAYSYRGKKYRYITREMFRKAIQEVLGKPKH